MFGTKIGFDALLIVINHLMACINIRRLEYATCATNIMMYYLFRISFNNSLGSIDLKVSGAKVLGENLLNCNKVQILW